MFHQWETGPSFICLPVSRSPRRSSLWPRWPKTCRSATRWPCPRSPWWTAARSGWCRPTCLWPPPSVRASRPSTTDTRPTGRVRLFCSQSSCCLVLLVLCRLTGDFLEVDLLTRFGRFNVCVLPPAVVRISPCHSRQPSVISDASAADGDRSSTPSDINSPRHRTHSLCNVRAAWPGPSLTPPRLVYQNLSPLCLLESVPLLGVSLLACDACYFSFKCIYSSRLTFSLSCWRLDEMRMKK